ncbi:hypothetical protein AMATHDRAFT_151825 [Amanita thiersii Skay4041]|uniref:DUF7598 domain-containing protein n=1 Tax=Amanita thiersii Skay4041 TaxID=703135 RepID=A0A2A9NIR4_9AGAR|nr:hypothetical protein AMATHDRAFT_151825 [Amanita thiersii Skay4041]
MRVVADLFIGLNVIRLVSIVTLVLVIASNIVTLVHDVLAVNRDGVITNSTLMGIQDSDYIFGSTVPNQPAGAFWAVLNRLLIIGQTIVLLLSEFGWPAVFFDRYFPVLGKEFGLGALGLMQCLIGAAVLSHHVDTFTLVSAFLVFSIGCLHILLGLIFGSSARAKRSMTSWRDQDGAQAQVPVLPSYTGSGSLGPAGGAPMGMGLGSRSVSMPSMNAVGGSGGLGVRAETPSSKVGMGFGRQAEKAAVLKGYLLTKPVESLPRYAPRTTPISDQQRQSSSGAAGEFSPTPTAISPRML